jgi:signal transduction histidine kinase
VKRWYRPEGPFASGRSHGEDLGARDRAITVVGEGESPGVVHVGIEACLRREVKHLHLRWSLIPEIPETVDDYPTVVGDEDEHGVLISGELVKTPGDGPQHHAEIYWVRHLPSVWRGQPHRQVKKARGGPDIPLVIRSRAIAPAEVEMLVSAVPIPVLVADYSPIIERFAGMHVESIRTLLSEDEDVLTETLALPRPLAASPEWIRLYGSPLTDEVPDFAERRFTREAYPDLHETLIQQFTAPFTGTTSLVREHTAPTLLGDVVVRSHWRALLDLGEPQWDRIVIVDLDVTDLRDAQRDMQTLLDEKEELVRSKDQLIASVSHEIRTPLSSIVGFAQLLREASDLSGEERREMIELVAQESADLTNIVDDLLVAAKADLGRLEVACVAVDLRAQAAQAIEGIDASRSRITQFPNSTARCLGDPARVRQVIRNLLSNAIKYGGAEITIEVQARNGVGVLEVADNGTGIPETERARIFDAYERGDQPAGLTHSLGLGLHISRSLAHRMGGALTYRYENGRSIFELTLPLAERD